MDSDENIYYHKKLILILYDMIHGELLYHEKNKNNLDIDKIVKAFDFAILIYFNKYEKKSSTLKIDSKEIFNSEFNSNVKEFIYCNILDKYKLEQNDFSKPITVDQLTEFIDKKLPALDGFIMSYFSYSIDHYSYKNPISKNFKTDTFAIPNRSLRKMYNYYFNGAKYESDNGLLFQKKKYNKFF